LEGYAMKKLSLIAGLASIAATTAVLWSMPAVADSDSVYHEAHDKWPGQDNYVPRENSYDPGQHSNQGSPSGMPEPGILALLALGAGGLGFAARRRKPKA
jgi:hypothetical protein